MSSLARKLADLIDSSGDVKSDRLDNTISLGDNVKATFGASDDLQIYHDGSNSVVRDAGTGNLILQAGNFEVTNGDASQNIMTGTVGGAVRIYHNNAEKLATTSTGVKVSGSGATVVIGNHATAVTEITHDTATSAYTIYNNKDSAGHDFEVNGSKKVRIDSSGNVGIGTTSPSEKLEVYGGSFRLLGSNGAGVRITHGNSENGGEVNLLNTTGAVRGLIDYVDADDNGEGAMRFLNLSSTGNMEIGTDGAEVRFRVGGTEKMRINSNGNVGIGTSSPAAKLHAKNSSGDCSIRVESGSGSSWLTMLNTSAAYIHNASNTPTVLTTNGTERMRIDSSGNVGIGTSSPSAKLDVAGEVQCDSLDVDGNGDVTGTFTFHGSSSYTKTIGGANSDKWSSSFSVGGNHSTYYPVVFNIDNNGMDNLINISRSFGATAPYEWNNSNTHKGGLALTVAVSGGAWGGMPQTHSIFRMETSYTTIVAKTAMVNHGMNWCVWLRGGNAQYWVQSDKPINYTVYLSDTNLQNATHPAWVYTTTSVTISNKDYSV